MEYHHRIVLNSGKSIRDGNYIDRIDRDEQFCQRHAVVAVACLYSLTSDLNEWDPTQLDSIGVEGDFAYYIMETESGEKISRETISRIIQLGYKTNDDGRNMMIEFALDQSFTGSISNMLDKFRKYMESTVDGSRRVLIKSERICFGIFDVITSDGITEFCLFDPNGRDWRGFCDWRQFLGCANASILYFKKIESLFALFERDGVFYESTCECIPIRSVEFSDETKPLIVFPIRPTDWSDEYDTSDEEEASTSAVVLTRSGRIVQQPEQFQFEPHPSFWRGKERQDAQRMKRNKDRFLAKQPKKPKRNKRPKPLPFDVWKRIYGKKFFSKKANRDLL